jgi:hypothetical protein
LQELPDPVFKVTDNYAMMSPYGEIIIGACYEQEGGKEVIMVHPKTCCKRLQILNQLIYRHLFGHDKDVVALA